MLAFFAVVLRCGSLQSASQPRRFPQLAVDLAARGHKRVKSEDDVARIKMDLLYDLADLPFETDIYEIIQEKLEMLDANATPIEMEVTSIWPFNRRQSAAKMHPEFDTTPRSRPLLWIHIHKAGGTFICAMAQLAGEKVTEPSDGACNWLWHDQYRDSGDVERISCKERSDYFRDPTRNYTWGQIEREFAEADRCWNEFDYGVMLREPVALLESEVNYHPSCWFLGKPCGGGPDDPADFLRTFKEMLASPSDIPDNDQYALWKYFDNIQVRLLAPALDVPAGKLNETHLNAAKESLAKFKIIARLEDLPHVGPKVFDKLGWSQKMMAHVGEPVNMNKNGHDYIFSEDEVKWLRHVNRFDRALWEAYEP